MNVLDPVAVPLVSTTLVEASAGTGKTHTIATLYLRCLLEIPLDVRRILVVTYTNAATAELRERVRSRIREALAAFRRQDASIRGDAILASLLEASRTRGTVPRDAIRLVRALQDFDEAAIFTIHGFCQRMLQENAFESRAPFDAEVAGEPVLLRDEVVRDFLALRLVEAPEPVVRAAAHLGIASLGLDRLARIAGSNPRLAVLPETVEPPGVEAATAAWRAAIGRAAGIWASGREEIVAALSDRRRMRGNFYPPDRVAAWAEGMDAYLRAGAAGLYRKFRLEKFTTAEVRKGAKGAPPQHEFFEACDALAAEAQALRTILERHALWLRRDFVDYARSELRKRKEERNQQSFDDLLHRLADALAGSGGTQLADAIAERFHAALIDEFQDTDPVQYEIFRRIYAGRDRPVFLIGDPKQAIYSFRGADVHTYMAARDDAGEHRHTLDTNYRSDPRLIDAVNALFRGRRRPFLLDRVEFQPVRAGPDARERLGGSFAGRPPFEILLAPEERIGRTRGEELSSALVAGEISRFLQSGATIDDRGVEAGDLAVLCRTNKQARLVQAELQKLYVPCVLQGDSSVFDTAEAEEIERVLLAIADPGDSSAVRAALATTIAGLDAVELAALQRDERAWDARVRQFAAFGDSWTTEGFVPAFRRMLDGLGVQPRLLERLDGERRLTNVMHLAELLQNAATEAHRGPLALIEWLGRMRRDRSSRGDVAGDAEQIRLESDAKRVKITTIHQAKGLEYPVVYCPFLWGKLFERPSGDPLSFHDPGRGWEAALDLGSERWTEHKALAEFEELAENLRLLYVAVTRAKHRCTIVWGAFTAAASSALGYVLHRPPDLRDAARLAEIVAAVGARTASLETIREDLERLAREAGGAIGVSDFPTSAAPAYRRQSDAAGLLAPRATKRPPLTATWRVSSFTSLAAGGGLSEPAREGLDRDEAADEALAEEAAARRAVARRIVLDEFPRGARTGDLVHEILEHLDFTRVGDASLSAEIERRLESYGFGAEWADRLCRSVRDVVATPLGGAAGDVRLGDVPARQRLNEMEFVFPVAAASSALTPQGLAATLGARWQIAPPDYPERVARLRFQPLAGFLRGFVDLVFEHGGRWYVVDYKSSFLGPAPDDYRISRLVHAMAQHHFLLQYHLYAVAVDRHLRQCVPGYDYETHFGGVYYLFVRGMSPDHPRGHGVFHDRPSRALVEELSAMLTPERGERGAK